MAQVRVGDALQKLLKDNNWQARVNKGLLETHWEAIMGKTISRYTREIRLHKGALTIYTDVGPLKQELQLAKDLIRRNINEYFNQQIVEEVVIR